MQLWSLTSRGLALSALALSLAACQSVRVVEHPQPTVQAEIPAQFNHTQQAKALQPSIAELGYKDFFADQRLTQVIELALSNNRDMRIATLNIQKAQQQYRISENNQLPTIGASGSILRQDTAASPSAMSVYNVGLGTTAYEIDFWGRVRSLKDATLDNFLATQSAKDATQIALIAQIAQAWTNYAFAKAHLSVAEQTLKAQLETYDLNMKRFKAGIDSEIPSRQSQVSVETARNDVASYKTQVAQAENLINLLVGQQVPKNLLPNQAIKQITSQKTLGAGLSSDLLNNRPDLKIAEYQLSAAGANITAAKARLYPTISLTGTAGLASTSLSNLFKSGAFIWNIGPSIDLPIFDWGTRKNNIKISETEQQIALANYEKAIQVAFSEVNDALATRAYISDRLSAQNRLVEATGVTHKLTMARFRAGIDSYLSVLDAQRSSYNAQQALLTLQQANINNQIELYKSLGGGIKTYRNDERIDLPTSSESRLAEKQHYLEQKKNSQ